jgi:hypothetical protein
MQQTKQSFSAWFGGTRLNGALRCDLCYLTYPGWLPDRIPIPKILLFFIIVLTPDSWIFPTFYRS